MFAAVADTHAATWYLYDDARLSDAANDAFDNAVADGNQIAVSAITLAEIIYLEEKGRLLPETFAKSYVAIRTSRTVLTEIPVTHQVIRAMTRIPREQVPDLPDRIIAATALMLAVPVITRDGKIQTSTVTSIW